jgi:hypothetical protein
MLIRTPPRPIRQPRARAGVGSGELRLNSGGVVAAAVLGHANAAMIARALRLQNGDKSSSFAHGAFCRYTAGLSGKVAQGQGLATRNPL